MRRAASIAAVLASGLAVTAFGQQAPTTVQLPTFSFTTVLTSVSVPDRGSAYLGGIKRAREGSGTRGLGPLANKAGGRDHVAGGMSVHATIIDLAEMDERILAEAAAKRAPTDPTLAKAESLTRYVGRGILGASAGSSDRVAVGGAADHGASAAPVESVAAIRQANAAAAEARASEAEGFLAKARQAEVDNKPAVAKIYYQMVVRRDQGELAQFAQSRLAALAGSTAAVAAR
jgi:hypothetical protein